MTASHYILRGHEVVKVSRQEHMRWFASDPEWRIEARRVGRDEIGETLVSTVFTGMDEAYGEGPPLLFGTMVMNGPLHGEKVCCTTWEQAEAAHKAMCERVRNTT